MEPAPLLHSLEPVDIPLCVKSNGADGSESGLLNSAAMVRRRMPMGREEVIALSCPVLSTILASVGSGSEGFWRVTEKPTYLSGIRA